MKALALFLMLAGCATTPAAAPADAFFARLQSLCGKAFAGNVVTTDAADAEMAGKHLTMHVRECSEDEIRIPFHVGEDRSRTWVVARQPVGLSLDESTTRIVIGLTLKHDHRHEDGSADVLTNYGGDSSGSSARRQIFPADVESRQLFKTRGNPASVTNVWAIEVEPGRIFAYELRRANRHFRVEFDLTRPVAAPPPPWGAR